MVIRRAFGVSRIAAVLVVSLWALGTPASAQRVLQTPPIDIFAGYSYLRFDPTPLGFPHQLNLNGGNFQIAVPVYHDFGIVVDVSGHYASELKEYNFLIGGQYKFEVKGVHLLAHAMGGKARTRLEHIGTSTIEPSSLGGAGLVGGGIEFPWKQRILFRPVQADYLINGAFGDKFKNIRVSSGLVFLLGKRPKETPNF